MHAHHYYRFAASLLTVLLAACGGGGGPGAAEDKPVVVPSQPSTPIDKTLLTGTLKLANTADARVFWDRNDNWEIDADEVPVQVDPTGSYLIAAKPTEAARLRVHVAGGRMVEEGISHTAYVLSSLPGETSEVSPWTTLQALSGLDLAQLSERLGVSLTGAGSDVAVTTRAAKVVSMQLAKHREAILAGRQDEAAAGVLFYAREILAGTDFLSGSQTSLAAAPLKRAQAATPVLPTAIPSQPNYFWQSAAATPFLTPSQSGHSTQSISIVKWKNKVVIPPESNRALFNATETVLANLKQRQVDVKSDGLGPSLGRLDRRFAQTQISIFNQVGLKWAGDASIDRAVSTVISRLNEDQYSDELSLNIAQGISDFDNAVWAQVSKYDGISAIAELEAGLIQAYVGIDVGDLKFASRNRYGINKKIGLLFKVILTGQDSLGCFYQVTEEFPQLARIRDATFDVAKLSDDDYWKLLEAASKCLTAGAHALNPQGIAKLLIDRFSIASNLALLGHKLPSGATTLQIRLAVLKALVEVTDGVPEHLPAKPAGVFRMANSFMKMLVVATEAVVANEGKWNAIASQISAAYDARRNELLNMAEQSKLRARLEQVMSPVYYDEVIDLGRMRSCAIRSELKSLCSYRSVAVAAAKMRVLAARTAADPLGANVVAMALNDPAQIPIEVSFGDGWSTANDPAYRGKALNATSEVEHAYLTPGRYRVRTEFRLPEGGRFMQEEDLEVTQSADSAAAPTALRISPPVVLADQPVTLSVAVETPTSFRDLTARLIALGADGVPRAQCDIPSPNPGAVLAAGTYALTGCGQLVKATDQGLSIAVSALAKDGVKSRRAELMVAVSPKALVVQALTASQSSAGQPINGSFSVAGSSVSLVRVHAGLSASDTYCYTDLAATTGAKTFSFSGSWAGQNGKACSALLPAAGGTTNIVFKVEARDSNNNLANSGTPPTATVAYQAASTPISVTALTASQSSAGQPINGSFSVAGSSVSLVRVHAGLSASDTYCYTDLAATTGAKTFSFSGSWAGQNGKACSALLPAAGGTTNIVFKVEARDSNNNLANSGTPPTATVAYQAASTPISVTALTASQSSAGQPINGSFSVAGSSVSLVRVHAGLSASDTYCYTDLSASTGAKSFSFSGSWTGQNGKACSALLPAAGGTTNIVFKVEARDSNNNLANSGTPPTATVAYQAASTPISVTALTASQSSAGQPINGSFSVAGSSVSLVRVHAGLSASDTYCYTDLSASTGAKSFSFSGSWTGQNGKACSALLPAAGGTTNIVFKVEARDSNNNLANSGTPPTATVAYQAASTPISVTALTASQSSAGQPINGSFSVAGSSVSLVRVHAGLSASDTYCYTDLAATTGAKTFSFSGSWTGQNGKACSALLPAAGGTTNIVFKVEARDSNNNLANSGTPPTATVAYQAASTPISVTALTASQSSAGQPINGSFSVAGSSVSLVRVHAGLSASDTYCYTDLSASTGAKSFSFSGSWTGQNGKACSALLPAAGATTNIVFKVEARDSNNNLANSGTPPTATVAYQAASTPISVTALTASQSSAGQPINGSFSVAGSSVSLVRVHAGLSASDTYCYTDLSASTGAKSFSFSGSWTGQNGKACSALLPAAGATTNIVFKVEARDSNNNLANSGTPPTATVAYQAASTPISVTALTASQSSAGQPINGSFAVAGSSVSLVRVHAGLSASDTYCYTDLSASTGAKSFSFSGSWAGQNGKACSALLPAAGATTNIVFKVEARDSNNNLANSGTPPTATVAYQAATLASVTGRSPSSLTRNSATAVTVSGVGFPDTVVFAIDNVVCNGDYVRTATSVRQTCTAQNGTPSSVALLVKTQSGGNTLIGGDRNFSFAVR